MQGIKDKVIVITGASSGIGEATAVLLAGQGAKLVLGARGLDRLHGLVERIVASGGVAEKLRVTVISPGFTRTNFADSMTDPKIRAETIASMEKFGMAPDALARAIAFAIEQPAEIDVGEIIVRPTAQA